MSYNPDNAEKVGPWGSQVGTYWSYLPNFPIQKITVRHVGIFNSVMFGNWNEEVEELETTGIYGGRGGTTETVIELDWPTEYLTGISGTCATVEGTYCVESMAFLTNKDKYGPYGTTTGTPFEYTPGDQIIVGFFGRFNPSHFIENIGVYAKNADDVIGSTIKTITPKVGSASIKDKEDKPKACFK